MTKTVDITPSPRVLRMLGQIDFAPWQCLAELIDNSIDAFIDEGKTGVLLSAPRITIALPTDAELRAGTGELRIEDNAGGMSLEDMASAVKAGYSGNDPIEKMGLFGMGFNISTARLGRKTEVWTSTADSSHWVGIVIDFSELERAQTFHVPIRTQKKTDAELETAAHGTRIVISELESERMRPLIWGQGKAKTRNRLGKIYGRVMSRLDIVISYDGDAINPWRHCVWDSERSVPNAEFGNVPARIEIDEELAARRYCSTCWVWLTDVDKDCTACGTSDNVIERKRRITGWLGIQRYFDKEHYGFDLIRNGRVIEDLDKSLFRFRSDDGEEVTEYPLDGHWGGRIVGELEIDFVRVSHQKDSFDKLDPEWRHVVSIVRGNSPIRPQIAKKMNLDRNKSPLSRLFAAYRKTTAGLKYLVPGDAKGAGLNTGVIQEYVSNFYAGETEFQSDERWYDLVLQAERVQGGSTSGSEELEGELPIDDEDDAAPVSDDSDPTEESVTLKTIEPVLDAELSRSYELKDLPGSPEIAVSAYQYPRGSLGGQPFKVTPVGFKIRFDYEPKSDFFESSLESPSDFLVVDMAHHFLGLAALTPREWPISYIAALIRKEYFSDTLSDINSSADVAESLLADIRRHYDEFLSTQSPIDPGVIGAEQLRSVRARALSAESMNETESDEAIRDGLFARFVDNKFIPRMVEIWPSVVTDGKFFSTPYDSVSEELRPLSLSTLVGALHDIRWVAEEGSSSVSKDAPWRLRYGRALASLRLAQSWLE